MVGMSIVPRSFKSILFLDILFYLFGLLGIYLFSIKSDLPFQTEYKDSAILITNSVDSFSANLTGKIITTIDGFVFVSPEQTENYLSSLQIGDNVKITFADNSEVEVKLVNYYSFWYCLLAWLIGTSFFVIAIIVLVKARAQKPARLFHWVCIFTALIIMTTWGYYNLQPKFIPIAVRALLHFSVSIVPTIFLHFTLVFPREKKLISPCRISFLYILAAMLFILLNYNFLSQVYELNISNIKAYVLSYNIARSFLIICVIAAIGIFIHSYKTSPSESDKKKLKWILYGFSIGPLGFILLWAIPILLTNKSLLPEEMILILVSVIPITFGISIVKYHVMDVDQLINRSVVYAGVIGILLAFYLLIIGVLTNLTANVDSKTASIITALFIALLFQPFRIKVQKFIDKKFFRVQYNFREALKKFFEEIEHSSSINLLAEKVVNRTYELVPVEKIGFFVLSHENKLTLKSHKHFDLLEHRSIRFQQENLKTELTLPIALPDRVESGVPIETADYKVFQRWGMNLVFPLKSKGSETIGFLVLGEKKSAAKFTIEDVDLLNAVANRTADAIHRIKLQEELVLERVESERLDELNRMKSYFVSSVSHDMKTPLTSIKMFAELLQSSEEIKSEKSKEYLEIIEGESSRLARLIDNVLDFSKIERGVKQYRFEITNLNNIAEQTVKMMQYQFNLHKFNVELNLSKNEYLIYVDRDAVEEALINLISNSFKYSKEKKWIGVETYVQDNFMVLSVKDEGIGISRENSENIFHPFYRIDSKESQRTGGAGLGLSIVKHIMDAHEGKIEVLSELGKGSNFILSFPILKQ